MRFTDFDKDNDDDDEYDESDIEAEMMNDVLQNQQEELHIANQQLQYELIDKAIFICKSNWYWGFLPHSMKLQQISETHEKLQDLL